MKTFNDWYTRINEELAEPVATATTAEPTTDKVDVTADRDAMISDVDAIMTSLETLAGELKEGLEVEEVNEADSELGAISDIATKAAIGAAAAGGAVALGAKWIMSKLKAKKAKKAQQGVNTMLMNVELAKLKVKETEDPKAKELMNAKIDGMKSKAEELQSAYVEKFKDNNLAAKALESERLKGSIQRLEFLAKETGSESYKKEAAKLQDSYKDTLTDLENLKKEGEEASAKAKEEKPEETPKGGEETPKNTEETPKGGEETSTEETPKNGEETEEVPTTTTTSSDDKPEKNSKEDKLSRLDALMAKAKESGDEAKIKKVQDLIDKVSAKESWQLEGTYLGQLLESEIKKLETEEVLFESKNTSISIKDKLSRLI